MSPNRAAPIEILLIEDNPGDVRLTREALKDGKVMNNLLVAPDGAVATEYLQGCVRTGRQLPDIVLLDLNLPLKDGREVLAEIKCDERLRHIPVVVLTTSKAEEDIIRSYQLHANCYITKPVSLDRFMEVIKEVENFWLCIVKLPPRGA